MISPDPSTRNESGYAILQIAAHDGPWTLFGQRAERFRGAFCTSLLSHAGFLLLLYVALTLPQTRGTDGAAPPFVAHELVWLDVPGPGGGGGGGGNQSAAPAQKLQTPGPDALSVPVAKAPALEPPQDIPKPQEPPPLTMVLPVRAMDAGQLAVIGALDGSNLAPPNSQGSGKDGGAGTGRGPGSGPGEGPGLGPGSNGGFGGEGYRVGNGVLSPQLLREVRPNYTTDAMRAKIQGEVLVSAVVLPNGTVTNLHIVRSLDRVFGLDEQALNAVAQWLFKPGTRLGQPVPVQISISVAFALR